MFPVLFLVFSASVPSFYVCDRIVVVPSCLASLDQFFPASCRRLFVCRTPYWKLIVMYLLFLCWSNQHFHYERFPSQLPCIFLVQSHGEFLLVMAAPAVLFSVDNLFVDKATFVVISYDKSCYQSLVLPTSVFWWASYFVGLPSSSFCKVKVGCYVVRFLFYTLILCSFTDFIVKSPATVDWFRSSFMLDLMIVSLAWQGKYNWINFSKPKRSDREDMKLVHSNHVSGYSTVSKQCISYSTTSVA